MKHYLVFYVSDAAGRFRFYASICEEQGQDLIAYIKAQLAGTDYKTQRHWDCDTASRTMVE